MRVHSLRLVNFGPFKSLEDFRFDSISTIIGQNDTGKSHILRALKIFLNGGDIEIGNVYNGANLGENVIIEIAFDSLPDHIELEDGSQSTLKDENLLDANGHLRIGIIFLVPGKGLPIYESQRYIIANDFIDEDFAGLALLDRNDLDNLCKENSINIKTRGPGATNKSKREALRAKARDNYIPVKEWSFPLRRNLKKYLGSLLPDFELFGADKKSGGEEDSFKNYLLSILNLVSTNTDIQEKQVAFIGALYQSFNEEMAKVIRVLQQYTNSFSSLSVVPELNLQEAIIFKIYRKDRDGVETSIDNIGSGSQRLLMLALFQYLAGRDNDENKNFIFAIEEPENCLHPGLQRKLAQAFNQLADKGYQIILTSHSPVFVGQSPIEALTLVTMNGEGARINQYPDINPEEIANQLGIEPVDQITGYNACVFVEGPKDVEFWKNVSSKLKRSLHIDANFEDKNIGFIIHGGDNLKHWIDLKAMQRINRRFAVIIDSDKKSAEQNISGKKLNWKRKCEEQGGKFFILRKRNIENYIHREAIKRSNLEMKNYDDFSNMKDLFGDNVYKLIKEMSSDEILEIDKYYDNGTEHHELKEIIDSIISI